jgi:HK97 family phage prohead protease
MKLETKSINFSVKSMDEDELGTFTAYGNTFDNVDEAGEVTMKGAFSNMIKSYNESGRMPRLLSQHGHRQNPIGVITSMVEDEKGLLFTGKFCTAQGTMGAEAYELVKMGALDSFSIGFNVLKHKFVDGRKELHEIDVKEISLVTFAANEQSLIQSIKSALGTGDEVTRMVQKSLQDSGLSKRQASAAIDAIKASRELDKSSLNAFVLESKSHDVVIDVELKASCSSPDTELSEYVGRIVDAVMPTMKQSDDMYCYAYAVYMGYVIIKCHEFKENEQSIEYFHKAPYTVEGDNILVGAHSVVTRHVSWLTAEEELAREQAGVKQLADANTQELSEKLVTELKSIDFALWFK